jgi:hypothetical protein
MSDNDVRRQSGGVLVAFGRGLIRVLVSLLIGSGAGLTTLGISGQVKPIQWQQRESPPELFLALGVGLLTSGVLMGLMFMLGRGRKDRESPPRENRVG